jgi:hypothetical protein
MTAFHGDSTDDPSSRDGVDPDDPVSVRLAELVERTDHPGVERVARRYHGRSADVLAQDVRAKLRAGNGDLVARFEGVAGQVAATVTGPPAPSYDTATWLVRRKPDLAGYERVVVDAHDPTGDLPPVRRDLGRVGVVELARRLTPEWTLYDAVRDTVEAADDERTLGGRRPYREGEDL